MYMFSYDRQALSDLLDLFIGQRQIGKNVYILAGNHDWLGQHFIYHEGKKLADILNNIVLHHKDTSIHPDGTKHAAIYDTDNKIHFITEPETHTIE